MSRIEAIVAKLHDVDKGLLCSGKLQLRSPWFVLRNGTCNTEGTMAKTDFKSVDEYLSTQPESVRETLERVRGILRKALPKADEVISYQIPAYKLHGKAVIYFAGWKKHFSIYPATGPVTTKFKRELEPYKMSKGTIQFPFTEPIPAKLIAGIARLRAEVVAADEDSKAATVKSKLAKKR